MTPAIRGLAITLLPAAAWLTGTLRLFTEIADAVTDWAVHLVFSPKVWLGVILAPRSSCSSCRASCVTVGSAAAPRAVRRRAHRTSRSRVPCRRRSAARAPRRRRHRRRDRRDPQAARHLLTASNAERVLELVDQRPPTLGRGRLLCVDGPAGSGKTTLADEIKAITGAPVVHMDNLYEGWDGLPRVGERHAAAVAEPARDYRRWDWYADRWAEVVVVPPAPLLVLEGVGSGSRMAAGLITVLAWVEYRRPAARARPRARRRAPRRAAAGVVGGRGGALRPGGHPGASRPGHRRHPGCGRPLSPVCDGGII